jgi:hypothetical protein
VSKVRRLQKMQVRKAPKKAAEVRVSRTAAFDLDRYANDFVGFAALLDIVPKDGPKRKLRPNAIQAAFEFVRSGRDYVLKPRQVGLTTWELARDVWYFLTKPGAQVLVVCQSDKDDSAVAQSSEKVTRMLASLEELGVHFDFRRASATQWVLAGRDSSLKIIGAGASKAAAAKKGRSGTIHRLHVTEAAFFEHAATTMNALLKCVPEPETGSEIVIESTANGAAGWFFERYKAAKAGRSSYQALFFSWLQQEEYRTPLEPGEVIEPANDNDREQELVEKHGATAEQLKWFRKQVLDGGSADLVDQEYPTDEETCWITPGRTFFSKAQTKKLLAKSEAPRVLEDVGKDGAHGKLSIWTAPIQNAPYIVVVDPSEGLEGETEASSGDPGAAVVYRRDTGEHVATLHGYFPTWEMARLVAELGKRFNSAVLVIERNNHGHAVLQALSREQRYPEHLIYDDEDGRPGWNNGQISRATALEALEAAHRKGDWKTLDRGSLEEFLLFIVIKRKPQAQPGAHDDRLIAHAIANDVLSKVTSLDYDSSYDEDIPAMRV